MSSSHGPTAPENAEPSSRPPERRRLSDLPPAEGAERLATQLLDPDAFAFVRALRDAGLAPDLAGDELLRAATLVGEVRGIAARIDLLERYYEAAHHEDVARARVSVDRFFLQREGEPVTAARLVARLAFLTPELGEVRLERIGGGDDGPMVLRAGEHLAALLDDYEENLDTDQIDLREIEARRAAGDVTMVTVRGLVGAFNVLLDRFGVRERFVPLTSDAAREVYVALPLTEAIELQRAGHIEEETAEDLMELGGW